LYTGIGVSNHAMAIERSRQLEDLLKQHDASVSRAAEAAVAAVLQHFDEEVEEARRVDLLKLASDDESEEDENEQNEAGSAEQNEKKEEVQENSRKKAPVVEARSEIDDERAAKKAAEAALAEKKRKLSIAYNLPRDKLWSINFCCVEKLRLFSFSGDQIERARQTDQVRHSEEQISAQHEKIVQALEGIVEGYRALYKKEKKATIAALHVAAAQKQRCDEFRKQVDDLGERIRMEPEDETVLSLCEQLKSAKQDAYDICRIFTKVGQCAGSVKKGLSPEDSWCWLHCCGHTKTDAHCRKWIKKGDKFTCCGGELSQFDRPVTLVWLMSYIDGSTLSRKCGPADCATASTRRCALGQPQW